MLLDDDLVRDGHDGVQAQQVVADHGGGQRVHEAEHVVERGLGGLGVAAAHDEVILDPGSGHPLFGHIVAEVFNDLLAFGFFSDKLHRAIRGELFELFQNLFHVSRDLL